MALMKLVKWMLKYDALAAELNINNYIAIWIQFRSLQFDVLWFCCVPCGRRMMDVSREKDWTAQKQHPPIF